MFLDSILLYATFLSLPLLLSACRVLYVSSINRNSKSHLSSQEEVVIAFKSKLVQPTYS